MASQTSYRDWLKQDMGALLDALDLTDLERHFMRSRWLDQVLWNEARSDSARDWYYRLRVTAIIGGVIIPALVSLNVGQDFTETLRWITFGISLLVAIATTVEGFFRFGERWRHYRRSAEWLKIEGWHFFQLSGPYRRHKNHAEAYRAFAVRIEEVIQHDVDLFISQVAEEKEKKEEKEKGETNRQGDQKL